MLRGLSQRELETIVGQMLEDMEGNDVAPQSSEQGIIEVSHTFSPDGFKTFSAAGSAEMLAVDGGSATLLNGGSFVIAGIRVGQAFYRNREYEATVEPEMHLINPSAGDLETMYSIFFGKVVGGEPPDIPRGPEEAIGRIRTLLEWQQVDRLLGVDIAPGTVLAFDGALWAGIKGIGQLLEGIVEKARSRDIILCGISKRSMLTHRSKPLIPAVQMAGDDHLPGQMWHYPVEVSGYDDKLFGQVHVAKLHPRSRYVFRVDLSLPDGASAETALGKLAYYANDPTYAGYPYPLARVHNDVAFSRAGVEDLRGLLRSEALKRGMEAREWELTFQNFHDILDTGR